MKKISSILVLALALISLTACVSQLTSKTSSSSASSIQQEETAHFVIKTSDDKEEKKEVTFTKGQTILEVMQKEFQIKESNGIITSIDGINQDEAKKTYWMYKVNDEMAPKLAGETPLKKGDTVEFYLETF